MPSFATAKQAHSTRAASSTTTYVQFSKDVALPSSTIKSQGGGDGYDVFFDNAGHVFNIYHHASPAKMDCHTTDGGSCGPGWPFSLAPYGSDYYPTGYVDNTTHKIWFPMNGASNSGFGCLDVANLTTGPVWCGGSSDAGKGFITDATWAGSGGYDVARLAVDGTKLFTLNQNGKLQCLDISAASGAGAPCGTPTIDVGATFTEFVPGSVGINNPPMLVSSGGYIYGAAGAKVICVKASDESDCGTGYAVPSGTQTMTYLQPDSAGAIAAVCFKAISSTSSTTANCYKPNGVSTDTVTPNDGLAKSLVISATAAALWFPPPQTTGTRVYFGDGAINDPGKVGCYDVATNASCSGWPVDDSAYAITIDPNTAGCVWTNNNGGQIRSFNADGKPGCSAGGAVTTAFAPTLPCTGGTITSWQSFALSAPAATGYTAATLTVTDSKGAVVKSGKKTWSAVPITGATRTVDLTGLAVKDTGVAPTFTVTYTGLTATGNATAALVMGVKNAQGCTNTVPAPPTPFKASTAGGTGKKKSATIRTTIGSRIKLTLRSTNSGKTTAKGTTFRCVVPRAFRIASAPGGKIKGQTITWKIGDLKAKKTALRSLVLVPVGRGSHSVDFSVASENLVGATASAASIMVSGNAAPGVTG
ncbi:MAG: hypothetical protein ACR2JV_09655 [Gaiellales bacterium]